MTYTLDHLKSRCKINERGCWIWQDTRTNGGYAVIWTGQKRKAIRVARLAWELFNKKEMPSYRHACHDCDDPPCINPEHIYAGTPKTNAHDMYNRGRHSRAQPTLRKLTDEQVREIRAHVGPFTIVMARQYKVSPAVLHEVRRRITYKHVEDYSV